ncbi:MAG: hypothetical protein OSB41_02040, partial [Kiritimatiellae bacterium]|nr:hypothetical protein [Kiritimatiellia bacterium]
MKTKNLTIAVVVAALSIVPSVWAGSGIYGSFVTIDEAGQTYFDIDSATGNPDFGGHAFGTKTWGTDTLDIEGGEIQTFKNSGSNVTGAEVRYRVYRSGDTPGGFSNINLPYDSELGGGNQKWDVTSANTSLMNVQFINRATYTAEVFGVAFSSDGDHFANNGGANRKATFVPAGAREEHTIAAGSTDQSSIGDISGGMDASGDLVKKGAGELILDVANPDFDSDAYIDAGTLSVEHANGWQSAGTVNIGAVAGADDATFSIADTDGGYTFSDAVITRTGSGARTVGAI